MRRAEKFLWNLAGVVLVGIGTLGIFIPLLPTTIFWILAAACFSKSHPEWAERLYAHPKYGPHLIAWRDRRAISRKGKVAAVLTMSLSVVVVWFTAGGWWTLIPLAVLATIGTWIWTRAE
ncbi:MAG TPA: YbaN family protein [Novosphingobium sp.]|nr:YbaN family protein [Novosphingobium sp.]